jgi:hypothetical protein
MKTNVIVVDDFYSNPDQVRNFAIAQEFTISGNYPGSRTKSFLDQSLKDAIQTILWNHGGEVTNWHDTDGFTGSFQLTTAQDRSWIHSDHHNTWAAVCYLTPDAPVTGGTGLFRHKATGALTSDEMGDRLYESQDMTKWDLVDKIGNKYNRLAMYRGNIFHSSLDYFGTDINDGRLFQLFFISTQW